MPHPPRLLHYLVNDCRWDCEQQPELIVYSFGAPRVGNRPWADHYNQMVASTWRIVS